MRSSTSVHNKASNYLWMVNSWRSYSRQSTQNLFVNKCWSWNKTDWVGFFQHITYRVCLIVAHPVFLSKNYTIMPHCTAGSHLRLWYGIPSGLEITACLIFIHGFTHRACDIPPLLGLGTSRHQPHYPLVWFVRFVPQKTLNSYFLTLNLTTRIHISSQGDAHGLYLLQPFRLAMMVNRFIRDIVPRVWKAHTNIAYGIAIG